MIKYVPMNASDVSTENDELYWVGTNGLDSCVGLSIYDFNARVAGASHVYFTEDGFELDSCGNNVFNNFLGFDLKARELVSLCNQKGGNQYEFKIFNLNGRRKGTANLKKVVENTLEEFERSGLLIGRNYRDETGFIINARTGLIREF